MKKFQITPLSEDIERRFAQLSDCVIIDEAQQLPILFPALRSYVDDPQNKNKKFILLGSASPTLIKSVSESLAGRTSFLELTPFIFNEITALGENMIDHLWCYGGFPVPFLMDDTISRMDWFESYTRTFIERDLSVMGIDVSGPQMRRLWAMLAHFNGNIWNASQLAGSMGVNYQTVNRYTDILEQTFLIRRLQPYYRNIGKRIVKSPKIYFRDTGLLHYFLGIRIMERLQVHPARGNSWEAFAIEQICSTFTLEFPGCQFYYWRTAGGAEVDLIVDIGGYLIPFEIKLHSSPGKSMIKGLLSCMDDLNIKKGYVINYGQEIYSLKENVTVIPLKELLPDIYRVIPENLGF